MMSMFAYLLINDMTNENTVFSNYWQVAILRNRSNEFKNFVKVCMQGFELL